MSAEGTLFWGVLLAVLGYAAEYLIGFPPQVWWLGLALAAIGMIGLVVRPPS